MNKENWNPGHDINKGYPFNGVETQRLFPNRLQADIGEDGKAFFTCDPTIFTDLPEFNEVLTKQESFLLLRLIDFKKALEIAEDQVFALLEERPFIPEEMNFTLLYRNKDVTEPPVRIYGPKYDDRFSIHRKPANADDINWDPSIWTININENGVMKEFDIKLPCRRIAYAVFTSLGIKLVNPESEGSVAPVREEAPIAHEETSIIDDAKSPE